MSKTQHFKHEMPQKEKKKPVKGSRGWKRGREEEKRRENEKLNLIHNFYMHMFWLELMLSSRSLKQIPA